MSIGTSLGAFYEDQFHRAAAEWDPKYDNNEMAPETLEDNKKYKPDVIKVSDKYIANDAQRYNPDEGYTKFWNSDIPDLPTRQGEPTYGGYQAWRSQNGYTHGDADLYDYDLQGAYKAGMNPSDDTGHLGDQFKKPNHITFSDQSQYNGVGYFNPTTGELVDHSQGGHWEDIGEGHWSFTPSETNFQFHTPQEMIDYFDKYEVGNKLILPGQ